MQSWKREPNIDTLAPALHEWFQCELGSSVLDAEQGLIARGLTDCFGYHLLQLSIDNSLNLYGDCRVQRCFKAGPVLPSEGPCDTFVRCNYHELPFETDSLDVVLVHHVLEFAANPHAVLRELYRVTVPHGRIMLMGFNPWSLFGARMRVGSWRSDSVWRNHLLSAQRVADWLQVLGFEPERTDFGFYHLPLNRAVRRNSGDSSWARHLPFGGVYMITAVKQVAKFIPMKPKWAARPAVLSALPVAKPSTKIGQTAARTVNERPR
jgi:SAM-dependent methyltransferase